MSYTQQHASPKDEARQAFEAALQTLNPGDVAVDCGANVGLITAGLLSTGATVHAFEPNSDAFAVLQQRFSGVRNLVLHHAAVGTSDGCAPLYLHRNAEQDPVKWSTGSSLLIFKANVDPAQALSVPILDFAAFLRSLDRPVALLKMDIEGAEVEILHRLLDLGEVNRIRCAFIELHDAKIPELRPETDRLRDRIVQARLHHFNLNWI